MFELPEFPRIPSTMDHFKNPVSETMLTGEGAYVSKSLPGSQGFSSTNVRGPLYNKITQHAYNIQDRFAWGLLKKLLADKSKNIAALSQILKDSYHHLQNWLKFPEIYPCPFPLTEKQEKANLPESAKYSGSTLSVCVTLPSVEYTGQVDPNYFAAVAMNVGDSRSYILRLPKRTTEMNLEAKVIPLFERSYSTYDPNEISRMRQTLATLNQTERMSRMGVAEDVIVSAQVGDTRIPDKYTKDKPVINVVPPVIGDINSAQVINDPDLYVTTIPFDPNYVYFRICHSDGLTERPTDGKGLHDATILEELLQYAIYQFNLRVVTAPEIFDPENDTHMQFLLKAMTLRARELLSSDDISIAVSRIDPNQIAYTLDADGHGTQGDLMAEAAVMGVHTALTKAFGNALDEEKNDVIVDEVGQKKIAEAFFDEFLKLDEKARLQYLKLLRDSEYIHDNEPDEQVNELPFEISSKPAVAPTQQLSPYAGLTVVAGSKPRHNRSEPDIDLQRKSARVDTDLTQHHSATSNPELKF
jgi:serine/threonine protein phosphatase PrpC